MSTLPVAEQEAQRRWAVMREVLAEGFLPPAPRGQLSAIQEAANRLGLSRNTVTSWLNATKFTWPAVGQPTVTLTAPSAPPSPAEVRYLRAQDEVKALRRELESARRLELSAEDVRETVLGLATANLDVPDWVVKAKPPGGQPGLPIVCWSDWHIGETILADHAYGNKFDLDVADRRLNRLAERTLDLCFSHAGQDPAYPGIVVLALGDFVSGDIHDELRETNRITRNETVVWVVERLLAGLRSLLTRFPRVHLVGVPGNHGRDGRPRAKLLAQTNADWLILTLAERFAAMDPVLKDRVTWQVTTSGDANLTVAGRRYFVTHGDRLGVKGGDGIIGSIGPIVRGGFKIGRQQASLGRDFDTLVIGHFHQHIPLQAIRVSNCLCGPNEYGLLVLRAPPSVPSQALWFTHPKHGITAEYQVFLEDGLEPARAQAEVFS